MPNFKMLFLAFLGFLGFTTNASAALVIDTTAIMSDITTAGVAGLAIALAVAGIAIGVSLVRKLIRA